MATTTKLDKDEQDINVDIKTLQKYDWQFTIFNGQQARYHVQCMSMYFQSYLKESHLIAVKRIIKYLKGTIGMGLWYLKTEQFSMTSFLVSDYAGRRVDRKSTSGICQLLENCLIS